MARLDPLPSPIRIKRTSRSLAVRVSTRPPARPPASTHIRPRALSCADTDARARQDSGTEALHINARPAPAHERTRAHRKQPNGRKYDGTDPSRCISSEPINPTSRLT